MALGSLLRACARASGAVRRRWPRCDALLTTPHVVAFRRSSTGKLDVILERTKLTKRLRSATSVEEVFQLFVGAPAYLLSPIPASAAWVSLANDAKEFKVLAHDPSVLAALLSSTCAAFDNPDGSWRQDVQHLQQADEIGNPAAVVLWAVVKLHKLLPEVIKLLPILDRELGEWAWLTHMHHAALAIWGLGCLHEESRDGFEVTMSRLVARVLQRPEKLQEPLDAAMMARGLALRAHVSPELCRLIASVLRGTPCEGALDPGGRKATLYLAQAASSFAILKFRDDVFMTAGARRAEGLLSKMPDWDVCAFHWAFKELCPPDGRVAGAGFDGVWKDRGIIQGSSLFWVTGQRCSLKVVSANEILLGDAGRCHVGKLSEGGRAIAWDDGDVWRRQPQPHAGLQHALAGEVETRGLKATKSTVLRGLANAGRFIKRGKK